MKMTPWERFILVGGILSGIYIAYVEITFVVFNWDYVVSKFN